jgi:hypothetical protein
MGHGFGVDDLVRSWREHRFDSDEACRWISVGCWNAAIATEFREANVAPETAWHLLNPLGSVQYGYTSMRDLIARAKGFMSHDSCFGIRGDPHL